MKICKFCNQEITENIAAYKKNRFGNLCLRNECKTCRVKENLKYKKEKIKSICETCGELCTKKFKRAFCNLKCRFLFYVEKTETCWLWKGCIDDEGYGYLMVNNKQDQRAHRVSYELFNGTIDKDLIICHLCDIRNCVAPIHLWAGNHQENMLDMTEKGRQYSKLNPDQVYQIRKFKDQLTYEKIAERFKVTSATISDIINRKFWKHI